MNKLIGYAIIDINTSKRHWKGKLYSKESAARGAMTQMGYSNSNIYKVVPVFIVV